ERHAVAGLLADGLVAQDRAADVLVELRRGQEQLAVRPAVLLGVLDADAGEALGDRAGGLVDGDDALARGDHGNGGFGKLFDAHSLDSGTVGGAAQYSPSARAGPWPGPRAGRCGAPPAGRPPGPGTARPAARKGGGEGTRR